MSSVLRPLQFVCTLCLMLTSLGIGCDGGSGATNPSDDSVVDAAADTSPGDLNGEIQIDMVGTNTFPDTLDDTVDVIEEVVLPDTTPPMVTLVTPKDGALVTGVVLVEAEAYDNKGIARVEILIQDELLATLEAEPYQYEWDTGELVPGDYEITAIAYDLSDNPAEDSAMVQVQAECDEDGDCPPKSVKIINPVDGATVCGDFTIEATAQDDKGITEIEFFVDEQSLGVDVESPYQKKWDTTAYEHGDHELKVIARDTVGHEAFATASVKVDNTGATCDNLPSVTIEQPSNGAYVDGEVEIIISASDDIGVLKVQIFIDNALVAEDKMAPYKVTWDTTEFEEGAHTIKAIAYDTSDQMEQTQIQVTVDRTPPQVEILSPAWEEIYHDLVPIDIEAMDNFVIQYVEVSVDGDEVAVFEETPYSLDFDSTDIWGGEHEIEVMAVDGAGHVEWADMWFMIDRPPVVTIVDPDNDSVVFGEVEVIAEVAEDVDLASVVVHLDGEQLGYMDNDWGQHTYTWDTPYAKGTHTLTVVALDEVGQEGSAEISVIVDYPVTVSIEDCTSGQCFDFIAEQEVAGILALHAEASDDGEDIANVELHVDGLLEEVDSSEPYDFEWDSTAVEDGIHTITAVAKNTLDETGQVSVDVLVNNCDKDYDGYLALECGGSDCNDLDLNLNPGEPDTVGNEIDENCDGTDGVDTDGDGIPSITSGGADCNDALDTVGECQCGEECLEGQCEFTACDGMDCGSDGCGGNCGSCGCGEECIDGQCTFTACLDKECGFDGCGGTCGSCGCGEDCLYGQCIFTACIDKECGPDGCEGICGTCPDEEICTENDICEPHPCGDVQPGVGACDGQFLLLHCIDDDLVEVDCKDLGEDYWCAFDAFKGTYQCAQACVPQCSFQDGMPKECGYDGCYGTCGECPPGWDCVSGLCNPNLGAECGWVTASGSCYDNILWFCEQEALYFQECNDGDDVCTDDSCEDGTCKFLPTGVPGCCDPPEDGTQYLVDAGIEGAQLPAGWEVTDSAGEDVAWQVTNATACDGSYALYFGNGENYDCGQALCDGAVTTQEIDLSGVDNLYNLRLSFCTNISTEWDEVDQAAYPADNAHTVQIDVLYVEVLVGDEVTEVWNSDILHGTTHGLWDDAWADLSPYKGQTIRLRYRFYTGTAEPAHNDAAGIFIDNIRVEKVCGAVCGTVLDCTGGEDCTQAECNSGVCAYPTDPECCTAEINPDCDDGDPCTNDVCQMSNNTCLHNFSGDPECCSPNPSVFTDSFPSANQTAWYVPEEGVSCGIFPFDCENAEGENCMTCPTDCGACPVSWNVSADQSFTAPYSLYFGNPLLGNYENGQNPARGYIASPDVDLPPYGIPAVSFHLWLDTELTPIWWFFEQPVDFDILRLHVQPKSGGAYGDMTEIWNSMAWDFKGSTFDGVANDVIWKTVYVALDGLDLEGETVRFVFEFDSYDGSNNNFQGAYVDDIKTFTLCDDAFECLSAYDCTETTPAQPNCSLELCDSPDGEAGASGTCIEEANTLLYGCCVQEVIIGTTADFDAPCGMEDWEASPTADQNPVAWQVWGEADGGENQTPGGECALYFGNPKAGNYDAPGQAPQGTVTSPTWEIPADLDAEVEVSFWLWMDLGDTWSLTDVLSLHMGLKFYPTLPPSEEFLLWSKPCDMSLGLCDVPGFETYCNQWGCTTWPWGQWKHVSVIIPTAWFQGYSHLNFWFEFNAQDGTNNEGVGIFVDDFEVRNSCG